MNSAFLVAKNSALLIAKNSALLFTDYNGMDVIETDGGITFTGTDASSFFRLLQQRSSESYRFKPDNIKIDDGGITGNTPFPAGFNSGDDFLNQNEKPNFIDHGFNIDIYGESAVKDDNGGKKKVGNDKLRGGSQKYRDKDIKQYPKDFQNWYHKGLKPKIHPGRDATREELNEYYNDWLNEGKPTVKSVAVWTLIGIGTYEMLKWGAATLLAPETFGASYVAATVTP